MTLAACGGHAVDLGDGASDVGIGCNQPQPLLAVTATIPRLAAAASGSHLVVGWTADDSSFGNARITLDGADHIAAVDRDSLGHGGSYTGVSLAMADDYTILIALGMQDGHTQLVIDPGAPLMTTVQLTAPGGAVATGGSPEFALAGNDSATGMASIIGITAMGVVSAPIAIGTVAPRLVATRIKDGLAIGEVVAANTCELVPIDAAVTRSGSAIMFGAKQKCTQAVGAYADKSGETMLLHHDDGGLVIGTVVHTDRTLAAPGAVTTAATEPRAASTSAGTWVTYAKGGMVEAQLLDATGASQKTVKLGAISDASAHAVVSTGESAYALWIGSDLELARLCP